MSVITLAGCTPEPLGNYLKALGVFRLVAQQADPGARAWWKDGVFHLSADYFTDVESLATWLCSECEFTPLVAPWQKGSGYLPMGKREKGGAALRLLLGSDRPGLRRFRMAFEDFARAIGIDLSTSDPSTWQEVIADAASIQGSAAHGLLNEIDAGERGKAKVHRLLRNASRNAAVVDWVDAVGSAPPGGNDREIRWFPLLASGGGESSGQYVVNFQQRLREKLLPDTDRMAESYEQLMSSLTGALRAGVLEENKMGAMYYPALIKGFNSGQSFASKPDRRVNAWDFILLLEGTVLWASSATRRQLLGSRLPSFPFFCRAALGGAATLAVSEAEGSPGSPARGELWCPLWEFPVRISELRALLSEGRLQLGEKTCETALEFARAVARFGLDRGISAFSRFGLLERSGSGMQRTLLAVPLGRWVPRRLAHIELIDELDAFQRDVSVRLQHYDGQPKRLVLGRLNMERAVFEVAGQPLASDGPGNAGRLLDALVASAALERELGMKCGSVKFKDGQRLVNRTIAPIQPQLGRWIRPVDNGSAEFRLARAIASIAPWRASAHDGETVGALRSNLLPLRREDRRWVWDERSRSAVWSRGAGMFANLAAVLRRRLIDASRAAGEGLPLWGREGAEFTDLLALWRGEIDEGRLDDLIHALAVVDFQSDSTVSTGSEPRQSTRNDLADEGSDYRITFEAACGLPRAYALLKLCFVGGRLPPRPISGRVAIRTGDEPFPPAAPDVLSLLIAGRIGDAVTVAARRLRAKGYPPIIPDHAFGAGEFTQADARGRQLAGLLLVPVRRPRILAQLAIKPQIIQ